MSHHISCPPASPMPPQWGTGRHVEWRVGDAPIVLSVPHDGVLVPSQDDVRSGPGVVSEPDHHTQPLAGDIAAAFEKLTGKQPHVVICHLHRKCVDMNRDQDKAFGCDDCDECCDAAGHLAWNEYHDYIGNALDLATTATGRALYIDLHGQSHPENWIELGYGVSRHELEHPDEKINHPSVSSSVSMFAQVTGLDHATVLRGSHSFGALLEHLGHNAVPSPKNPSPGRRNYFNGGYSIRRHGFSDNINGMQIEVTRAVRATEQARKAFAADMALALAAHCSFYCDWSVETELLKSLDHPLAAPRTLKREV